MSLARVVLAGALLTALAGCGAAAPLPSPKQQRGVGVECGPSPLASASVDPATEATIRDRVESFVADFGAAWKRSARGDLTPSSVRSQVDAWHRELDGVVRRHLVAGGLTGEEDVIPTELASIPHDSGRERVTDVETDGTRATVRTQRSDDTWFVYRLVRLADEWRIERVLRVLWPPISPLMERADRQRLLDQVGARTRADPPAPTDEDLLRFFRPNARVVEIGSLRTTGVLTVHDFAWYGFDLSPFEQRVPAGAYPVSVALSRQGLNRAVRVHLADVPPVGWIPADRVGTGNEVPVDAANVAIADFSTMARCRIETLEEAYQVGLETIDTEPAKMFTLSGSVDDAVLVESGYGDGGYPAFWGVASDGTLTDLVVDFLVDSDD